MAGEFPSTRWSLVFSAQAPASEKALTALCEAYWYPLYAFTRRCGHDRDNALDLTQGFFAALIEKDYLGDLRPGEGRFRGFLLIALKHHIANTRARDRALKRGGGQTVFSLDADEAEQRYRHEPVDHRTPEKAYERSWALTILGRVERRLADEFEGAGRGELYRSLGPAILGRTPPLSHRETARNLGMSEDAVKMAVLRLRRHFGRLLREEVARTVASDRQIDDEIRALLKALRES